ncbi:MAG: DUF5060 domain-containing protein, partial [Chitinophagaceae bacterium]|nr:DUF5060 domain-containing protein [Chitinophagaceae bacterium]
MKQLSRFLFLSAFLLLLVDKTEGKAVKVQRWQPYDFEFKSKELTSNPFTINFSAEAVGPGNTKLILPGFYDGNGTWKIRFAPTKEGEWTITTK